MRLSLLLILSALASTAWGQTLPLSPEEPAAGRTLAQWSEQLDDSNEIVRLRAIKTLGVYGKAALSALRKALDDEHPGVVYWSCYHLGFLPRLGDASLVAQLEQLREQTTNPAVQMAVDYALVRQDGVAPHLERLAGKLSFDERGMACSAAEMLGRLGAEARPALPALRAALEQHSQSKGAGVDYHIRGAVQNAIRLIEPAELPPAKDNP